MSNDAVKNQGTKKAGIFRRFTRFLKDSKNELKKVVWPTKKQTINNTIVAVVCMLVAGVFIWLLDLGLGALVNLILSFAN